MSVEVESTYSIWIDERGYNFVGNSGVVAIGQERVAVDPQNPLYFQLNAFSIFPSKPEGGVAAAYLQLATYGYSSDQPGERVNLYAMSSPVETLYGSHTLGSLNGLMPAIYQDAQAGVLLGSYYWQHNNPGTIVQIPFSDEAVQWLNALDANRPFAIGYTVTDIAPTDNVWLTFSTTPGSAPTLGLDIVPEPSPLALLTVSMVLGYLLRIRR